MKKPKLIYGSNFVDGRGKVSFINGFSFNNIKRFYQVENSQSQKIRAFHGHLKEDKYVYVAKGKALIVCVPIDDPYKPNIKAMVTKTILSDGEPSIFYIPKGYANGFKILKRNTVVIFFSNKDVSESKKDDFRFPYDYWGKNIWKTTNK